MNEKQKAISLVSLIIVLLASALSFSGYRSYNLLVSQMIGAAEQRIDLAIQTVQEFSFGPYSKRISNLLNSDPQLLEAFAQRDRQRLYKRLQQRYQALKAENPAFHVMHFHLPDATTFLRMHKPEFYGDKLKGLRPMVDAVHRDHEMRSGFEVGKHGPFYRIVKPIFYQGHYVGALEFGIHAHELLASLEEKADIPVASFFRTDRLAKSSQVDFSNKLINGDYTILPHHHTLFGKLVDQLSLTSGDQRLTVDGTPYVIHVHHVFSDYQGTPLGGLLAVQDLSFFAQQKKYYLTRSIIVSLVLFLLALLVLYLGFGQIMGKLYHEIAQRRQTEARLRQAAAVFENSNEGVVITDPQAKVVAVNQAFSKISGYSEEEAVGQTPKLWKSDRHEEPFYQAMWSSLEHTGQWQGEIWNRRKNGTTHPVWMSISSINDDEGKLLNYISVFSDISSLKESQEHIQYLAHHDPLTDLPNRLLCNARLDQSIHYASRNQTKLAILFLDLDNFKQINDSLGHPTGDKVLQQVAKRLLTLVRQADTVARIAGDEFLVILQDIRSVDNCAQIADKIIRAFDEPLLVGEQPLHITISMGISMLPDDGEDSTTLVKNADAAMFRSKDKGKNNYSFYTAELTESATERLELENELRVAVKENQFEVYYQPQYDLASGQLSGAEALVRWIHPDKGIISPLKFIPIAESTGMIIDIGRWVLNEACRQASIWQNSGYHFPRIGVNVAGQQVQRANLLDESRQALAASGLAAQSLELEVTETFIMQQASEAINTLKELKELGLSLAIDDFGTGYSSLSYLKLLPIDKVKIDRSFVRDIPQDSNDEAIARAILAMAKSLQLKVIAEGVESEEQLNFLHQEECDEVQGFYYSPPLPAADFEELLKKQ